MVFTPKTIRIFISSTFKDMHTERDHLVRFIFPELKEICRRHHVELVDIDLRWGVTEEEAHSGKVLDICLDEIDTCRPFFLGLLGHRYGWVPLPVVVDAIFFDPIKEQGEEAEKLFLEAYKILPDYENEYLLIPEEELQRSWQHQYEKRRKSLITILKRAGVPNAGRSITAQEIYHGVLHNHLPEQILDLDALLQGRLPGIQPSQDEAQCLKRAYKYDPIRGKYILRHDVSQRDKETLKEIFKKSALYQRARSLFFFRDEKLTKELSQGSYDDFFEKDPEAQKALEELKAEIRASGLPVKTYSSIEEFGQMVRNALVERLDEIFKELHSAPPEDPLAQEEELHHIFMEERTRRFVGRAAALEEINRFVHAPEPRVMVVTGESGCGKSAFLARFTKEALVDLPDWLVIPHFVGASSSSSSLRETLHRFCQILFQVAPVVEKRESEEGIKETVEVPVPDDLNSLLTYFPKALEAAARKKNILLVIDAVNQFQKSDRSENMSWLPSSLPQGVKVVISTLKGPSLKALSARKDTQIFTLSGLTPKEVEEFVEAYLREIRRKFPNESVKNLFFQKVSHGHPLYLQVALEELRVFGRFEELSSRIEALPQDVPSLFEQVISRVEEDFTPALAQDFLCLIACGREGLTEEELKDLLSGHSKEEGPLPDLTLARLRRSLGPYLFSRQGVLDFFHQQLKEAVGRRYLSDERLRSHYHALIARYFEKRWPEPYVRALAELPHQLEKAEDWVGLVQVLTDLEFIHEKIKAGLPYALVEDYLQALKKLPKDTPGFKDLQAFFRFVRRELHLLKDFCKEFPQATFQQAINQPDSSPVQKAARRLLDEGKVTNPWFEWLNKPQCEDPCIMILEGHRDSIEQLLLTQDGRLISGASDETIRVWDIDTGECLYVLKGHRGSIEQLLLTQDGRLISGSWDTTIRVWDIDTGQCLHVLERLSCKCSLSKGKMLLKLLTHAHLDVFRTIIIQF